MVEVTAQSVESRDFPTIEHLRDELRELSGIKGRRLMVANRGEIAIRIFRTAHELGLQTVAIYSAEDRMCAHRSKADFSFEVGKGLSPVAAYLDMDGIVHIAKENKVDMIHPGYGLSLIHI